MKRLRSFVSITLIGGFMVILPIAIFIWLVEWLLGIVRGIIKPLSHWLVEQTAFTNYVAEIDTDAQHNVTLLRNGVVGLRHSCLECQRSFDRSHHPRQRRIRGTSSHIGVYQRRQLGPNRIRDFDRR